MDNASSSSGLATSASVPMETKRHPSGGSGRSRESTNSKTLAKLSTGESLEQSDFEVACATARVGGSAVVDDPIVCGTPPVKSVSFMRTLVLVNQQAKLQLSVYVNVLFNITTLGSI